VTTNGFLAENLKNVRHRTSGRKIMLTAWHWPDRLTTFVYNAASPMMQHMTQRCPTYIDTAHGADPYIYLQPYLGFISSYRFVNHTLFRQCFPSTWQLSSNIYMEYSSDDIAAARSLQFAMVRLLVDTRANNAWQSMFHQYINRAYCLNPFLCYLI
jgi:hypothetical protein